MIILMMIELFECLLVRIVQAFSLYVKIDDFCEKMHVLFLYNCWVFLLVCRGISMLV